MEDKQIKELTKELGEFLQQRSLRFAKVIRPNTIDIFATEPVDIWDEDQSLMPASFYRKIALKMIRNAIYTNEIEPDGHSVLTILAIQLGIDSEPILGKYPKRNEI